MPAASNKRTAADTARHCRDVDRRLRCAIIVALAIGVLLDMGAGPALAATAHPYNAGCEALARGDLNKAKALFLEAVKLDPSDTDALNNLAVCYMTAGDYREALPLLQKVLRLNTRYRGADLNIGAAYIFQDDLTRAKPPTEHAQSGGTTAAAKRVQAAAYYNLGLIAARQGRFADAKSAFERSLKVAPTPSARIGLACSSCALGDFGTGLPMLQGVKSTDEKTAAALKANLAAAYYQRGLAKLADRDLAGADDDFSRSNEAAANDFASLGHALVDAERGDSSAAAAMLDKLRASAESPALKRAAQANLDSLTARADSDSRWLKWLVWAAGAVLFSFQAYVLLGALAASRRRNARVVAKVVTGILAGLGAAVVLALAFFDPFRSPLWAGLALALDLVVVVLVWRSTSASPTFAPRS
jgi:tetratricopeptide (TPR) repeat protein